MLALRIALRYLVSRKSHGAVNVISLISVAGVAVATAAMVCVLSVFNGFSALALDGMSRIDPQLKVSPLRGKVFAGTDSLLAAARAVPGVAAALPVLEERALAEFYGRQIPVRLKGVPDLGYSAVSALGSTVIDGELPASMHAGTVPQALLSVGAAVQLEARPTEYVPLRLFAPRRRGRINPAAPLGAFRTDSLCIAGVWQADDREADAPAVLAPISVVRHLLDYHDAEASAIEIALLPDADTDAVRRLLASRLGPGVRVADRAMQQEASFRMVNIEKWVTFAMLAFILLIAAFNIVSTLAMLITEKERDAFTLAALGAPQTLVARIFTLEGALITTLGGLVGTALGCLLSLLQQLTGFIKLGGDHSIMVIDAYPVRVVWTDPLAVIILVAAVALLTSVAARLMAPRTDAAPSLQF